jgi:hypothetical protein
MLTDHKIIATDWQLKAAQEGKLGAVILPLGPQIEMHQYGSFLWCNKPETSWIADSVDQICNCPEFPYQIGDRIYLAEEWCKEDWSPALNDNIYFTKSTTPEAENIGWQPADTMPLKATDHCFEQK